MCHTLRLMRHSYFGCLSSSSGQTGGWMVYVAFLRGINVGGKAIVSMAAIKEALVDLGLSDVRTYINSGNVIFSTRASDTQKLGARIEKALEERTGIPIAVLVTDHKGLKRWSTRSHATGSTTRPCAPTSFCCGRSWTTARSSSGWRAGLGSTTSGTRLGL